MPKKPKQGSWLVRYFSRYNFTGIIIGGLFVYGGFLPSLLPRGWILQGVLSAILFCIGYGIGLVVSYTVRQFKVAEPAPARKKSIKKAVYSLMTAFYLIMLFLGARWQEEVNSLIGQSPENVLSVLGVVLVTLLFVMFILLVARSIRSLLGWVKKQTLKMLPKKLAVGLAWAVTILLVVGLVNGVIVGTLADALNTAYSVKNDSTDKGVVQPAGPELSGSPESLIAWDSLGRQGRNFISQARSAEKISAFNGQPAANPIRIYSGLKSAESSPKRADLAVADLKRAGGFDRKIIVVVTTTGTGWVDQDGVNPIEYMYGGNSAIVAMQYSYLPSSLSFLVDQSKAQQAGQDLYFTVLAEWLKLPADNRPNLVVFGESLGSFGSEAAFAGQSAFSATAGGAVWVGPPNFNTLRRTATEMREAGTPEIQPIVQNGEVVRFASRPDNFLTPDVSAWQNPRAVYLENPSDPIVWWSPSLIFHKPDWLSEPRGADVSNATRWLPFITFWQVSGDMLFSTGVPDGHGHKYGKLPANAWSYVAPPEGWTQDKTDALITELYK